MLERPARGVGPAGAARGAVRRERRDHRPAQRGERRGAAARARCRADRHRGRRAGGRATGAGGRRRSTSTATSPGSPCACPSRSRSASRRSPPARASRSTPGWSGRSPKSPPADPAGPRARAAGSQQTHHRLRPSLKGHARGQHDARVRVPQADHPVAARGRRAGRHHRRGPDDRGLVDVRPFDDNDAARDIAAATRVEMHGDTLTVTTPDPPGAWLWRRHARLRIIVRVPLDSALALKVASADLVARGRFGLVDTGHRRPATATSSTSPATPTSRRPAATSPSTGSTAPMQVNSASGDVADRHGTSGRQRPLRERRRAASAGPTASVKVACASGDIDIARTARGETPAPLRVRRRRRRRRPRGTGVWLDLSTSAGPGAQRPLDAAAGAGCPERGRLHLHVRSMSGDITVHRAPSDHPAAA